MKAVVFDGKLKFVKNHPVPRPGGNEALIRILMAGICNTDLEIIRGYLGFHGVIGHEFVGVVEEADGPARSMTGKRVVGEINCGCSVCDHCLKGLSKHCPDREVLGIFKKDGALAEYITLPADNLLEVAENIADEEAVFTEPLAAAFEIPEQVHIRPTDKILVMGDGKLGLLISAVLNLFCADVTLVGKHEKKLELARTGNINTVLLEELKNHGEYDIVVEATGSADGIETALQLVKPRGTVILKSTVAENKEINLTPVVINETIVMGSRCGPFEPALKALSKKLIDVKPFITEVFKFDKAGEAFRKAEAKDSLKIIIDFR